MRRLLFALLIGLVVSMACGGGSTDPSSTGGSGGSTSSGTKLQNGSMSAKIDGAQWTANAAIAVINTPAAGLQPAILSISGGDSSVRSIAFAVSPAGTGTYTVSSITMNTNLGLVINNQQWYASISDAGSSGSVTFTTLTNSRAAGTFAFVGVGSKSSPAAGTTRTITEGKFDVTF